MVAIDRSAGAKGQHFYAERRAAAQRIGSIPWLRLPNHDAAQHALRRKFMPLHPLAFATVSLLFATACCERDSMSALSSNIAPQKASHYVSLRGNDANPGTAAQPWRTLRHALTQLRAGSTLWIAGGVYRERGLDVALRGDEKLPIQIRSAFGERATIDAALPGFEDAPERAWIPHDPLRSVWRSSQPIPGLSVVYGRLPKDDSGRALVPYASYAALTSQNENFDPSGIYYCGPGLFYDATTGVIYARMQPSRVQTATRQAHPRNEDPRKLSLRIYAAGAALRLAPGSHHVDVRGIDIGGAEYGIELANGTANITAQDCDLEAGRYAVLARGGHHDLSFGQIRSDGRFPPWVARSDVKEPSIGPPANLMQGAAFQLEGAIARVTIDECTLQDCFDGIDTLAAVSSLEIANTSFVGMRDDAIEIASNAHHVDVHDNQILSCCSAISWNGHIAPQAADAGTKWIHHNVIDTRATAFYGRADPTGTLPTSWRGPLSDGMATGRPFNLHDTSNINGPDPWKVYRNTVVAGVDVDGDGIGIAYRFAPVDPSRPHEVIDNVFVLHGDQCMLRHARVHDGSQVFDGNVWARFGASATTPLMRQCDNNAVIADFASWNTFAISSHATAARAHYMPGWEANGAEGDPQFDANLHPRRGGLADGDGVPLAARPWPGATRGGWRGALAPR